MTQVLVLLAALVLLASVPIMLAARALGAGRTGFGSALLANVLSAVITTALEHLVPGGGLAGVAVAVLASSAVFAFVLETTLLRGFFIGLLSVLLTFTALLLLAGPLLVWGT
jgi:hypothetical protein